MSVTPFRKPINYESETQMSIDDMAQTSFDGSTIFRRTEAGNAEFRNRASLLPQRLKSILLLVDSRTTVEKFVASLRVYGDVSDLFQVLLDMGLIESAAGRAVTGRQAALSISDSIGVSVERRAAVPARFESEFAPVASPGDAAAKFEQHKQSEALASAASYLSGYDSVAKPANPNPRFEPNSSGRNTSGPSTLLKTGGATVNNDLPLRRGINMLTDWVPALFPNNSLDVMFELDKCRSREEFLNTLNDILPIMQKVWGPAEAKRRATHLQLILSGKL